MNTQLLFKFFLLSLTYGTMLNSKPNHTQITKSQIYEQFAPYTVHFQTLDTNSSYNELSRTIKATWIITQKLQETVNNPTASNTELTNVAIAINEIAPYTELFFTCKENALSSLITATLLIIELITVLNKIKRTFSTDNATLQLVNEGFATITNLYHKTHVLDYTKYVRTDTTVANNFKRIQILLAV